MSFFRQVPPDGLDRFNELRKAISFPRAKSSAVHCSWPSRDMEEASLLLVATPVDRILLRFFLTLLTVPPTSLTPILNAFGHGPSDQMGLPIFMVCSSRTCRVSDCVLTGPPSFIWRAWKAKKKTRKRFFFIVWLRREPGNGGGGSIYSNTVASVLVGIYRGSLLLKFLFNREHSDWTTAVELNEIRCNLFELYHFYQLGNAGKFGKAAKLLLNY